jgi:uncharacterized Zn-finger protein
MSDTPEPAEVTETPDQTVGCDGGGVQGHPLVFLNLEGKGEIDCPYCGKRFVHKKAST